jgi:hypothetical protein
MPMTVEIAMGGQADAGERLFASIARQDITAVVIEMIVKNVWVDRHLDDALL